MKSFLSVIILLLSLLSCTCCKTSEKPYADLQFELQEFVKDKDAQIGIGVIIDGRDTVEVNGRRRFPMMSVYKFPIALALAEECRASASIAGFGDSCLVRASDLHRDTYSPMMERYGSVDSTYISLRELLAYSLQMSDNNASDILLQRIGGAERVDAYVRSLGVDGMDIRWSEDEMHVDTARCRGNVSTPLAMAELLSRFDALHSDGLAAEIKHLMQTCATGTDRLALPLDSAGVLFGHKTGTGDVTPQGRLQAVNDVGYVHLPASGHSYTIAVFISDSSLDMHDTSAVIAEISRLVYQRVLREQSLK